MRLLFSLFLLLAAVQSAAAQDAVPVPAGYHLVWADEFDRNGSPDPQGWTFERGFVRNNELQWYQPENAFCTGGVLTIEGRRERKPNPDFGAEPKTWQNKREWINYTSASLVTKGLHSWQYGIFEVRARFKTQDGLWPAIWFMGLDGEWPDCGEIDMMEYYLGSIHANACWGTGRQWQGMWDIKIKPVQSFGDPAWDEKFHVWRMEWDSHEIKLSVDGLPLSTIDISHATNPGNTEPRNPFHQPHSLLINLAIGGDAAGDPAKTPFPTRYEIDYVRVYQKN